MTLHVHYYFFCNILANITDEQYDYSSFAQSSNETIGKYFDYLKFWQLYNKINIFVETNGKKISLQFSPTLCNRRRGNCRSLNLRYRARSWSGLRAQTANYVVKNSFLEIFIVLSNIYILCFTSLIRVI